tara:strand:- start:6521 stop:6784 length:264 start_codon:yes stop_codon:yes gene_type:complete
MTTQKNNLLELAREKARKTFKPNRSNRMRSIRLTGEDESYTIFYQMGATFIGTYANEKLEDFFKNKSVYSMVNNNTGKVTATMQRFK